MAYSPELLQAIVAAAQRHGVPADLLVATTLIESSGRLDAVGDGGTSHGPFQENDGGRGAGLTVAERRNPAGSADRAAREFAEFARQGFTGGKLAAAAQRPADPQGYATKVDGALPVARRLLAPGGGTVELEESIPGAAGGGGIPGAIADAAGTSVLDLLPDVPNPLDAISGAFSDAVRALLGFVSDWVLKVLAFVAIAAIAVWLIGQGASRAFGTPTAGEAINTIRPK